MTSNTENHIVIDARTRTSFVDRAIETKVRALLRLDATLPVQLARGLIDGRSIGKTKRMIAFKKQAARELIQLLKHRYKEEV